MNDYPSIRSRPCRPASRSRSPGAFERTCSYKLRAGAVCPDATSRSAQSRQACAQTACRLSSGDALSPEGDTVSPTIPELQAQPTQIVIDPQYADGLLGIEPGSDLLVLYFIDRARDDVLQVHPRGDFSRPLRGVFATRSPSRPNRIGLTSIRVLAVNGTTLDVIGLDALDGTPVLDIKSRSDTFDLPYKC